jgi:hypothetical protein
LFFLNLDMHMLHRSLKYYKPCIMDKGKNATWVILPPF